MNFFNICFMRNTCVSIFIADLNVDLKKFVIIFNFSVFIILKFFNFFFMISFVILFVSRETTIN